MMGRREHWESERDRRRESLSESRGNKKKKERKRGGNLNEIGLKAFRSLMRKKKNGRSRKIKRKGGFTV